jgi:hypothetical protein
LTLIEVLAAIFIMGIGTLAILVLFPLGALSMARALKDDRCATLAINSDALCWATNLRNDAAISGRLRNPPAGNLAGGIAIQPPDPLQEGYPVFIDPYFTVTPGAGPCIGGTDAGGNPRTAIVRVAPSFVPDQAACERWFNLTDDLTFTNTGLPAVSGPDPVRQGRYTYAYMLRQQQSQDPASANCTVIVYSGRLVNLPQPEPLIFDQTHGGPEPRFSALPNKGDTEINITWAAGQEPPGISRNGWIYDVTYRPLLPRNGPRSGVHGEFYRVVEATLTGNTMRIQIDPPLRHNYVNPVVGFPPIPAGPRFAILEHAVEVFDRGTSR